MWGAPKEKCARPDFAPPRYPGREKLTDLRRWYRIPAGLRHLRRYGLAATICRLFPALRTYRLWVRVYKITPQDASEIAEHIIEMRDRPMFSVLLPVAPCNLAILQNAIRSLIGQLYPEWELCIAVERAVYRPAAALIAAFGDGRIKIAATECGTGFTDLANAALSIARGRFVGLMGMGDEIACHALYMMAAELERYPSATMLYSDEDTIGRFRRRFAPHFKSNWNPDLLRGSDMVGRLTIYRRTLVERIGGFRHGFASVEEYDLALRASEQTGVDQIRHIPSVLYHRRLAADMSAAMPQSLCRALREHLVRSEITAEVTPLSRYSARVRYPVPMPRPGVSLIIPTRDRVGLLQRCISGLLFETDYSNLELLIIDNGSELAETHTYFTKLRAETAVRVLRYPGPFNYSAINNFGVDRARYDIIGLINNDIKVIHADWLFEMVSHALRPEIGAVGAKLYYMNDRIQHAGTIVGLGGAAGHAFRNLKRSSPGYRDRLFLTQNLSAVTAACMLLRKAVFLEVGGFDAANLAIAFNDVDLCLRIRDHGYRILWTPFAELYHRESASRGSDLAPAAVERFRREAAYLAKRWVSVIADDPYYNTNLTVDREDFSLSFPPRAPRPWKRPRPLATLSSIFGEQLSGSDADRPVLSTRDSP